VEANLIVGVRRGSGRKAFQIGFSKIGTSLSTGFLAHDKDDCTSSRHKILKDSPLFLIYGNNIS